MVIVFYNIGYKYNEYLPYKQILQHYLIFSKGRKMPYGRRKKPWQAGDCHKGGETKTSPLLLNNLT